MKNNNPEVIFKIRSHVDRRRLKDRRLSLKQEYLDHKPERRVDLNDRRMLGERRELLPEILNTFGEEALFSEQEYLDHNPERRANIIDRRMLGDRRGMLSRYSEYFSKKSALIFKRTPFGK